MTNIEAVYEDGWFKPLEEVQLKPGTKVRVTIIEPIISDEERLAAREAFFGSLSHEDAEHIRQFVEENFEQIDEELWK